MVMRIRVLRDKIPIYIFSVLLILPFMVDDAFARGGGGGWKNTPNINNQSFDVDEIVLTVQQ